MSVTRPGARLAAALLATFVAGVAPQWAAAATGVRPAAPVQSAAQPHRTAPARAPARVVTIAPHLTELLYAAGAGERLVGTIDTSDWPEAARRVPRIGDVTRLDAERLLALQPDLVLAWGDGSPKEQLALVRRLGLPVLEMQQHSLEDVPASIEQLGRLFGTEATAARAAGALRAELAALRARHAGAKRVRVFYQVWGQPLYTLGGGHVVTEMLRVCGAENVFADQRTSGFAVDEEAVYARDPDAIVLAGVPQETRAWRERWQRAPRLRAVENRAIVDLAPDLVNRMGPRIGQGTAALCAQLATVRR